MKIKDLKKENKILGLSVLDMLVSFDTSKTKKYSQFLVKMLNQKLKDFEESNSDLTPLKVRRTEQPVDRVLDDHLFEHTIGRHLICELIFDWGRMNRFIEFTELMERGLINEKDITKYDSWEMLEIELYDAKNRELFKNSKKEIHKIFEDERYLIFKPLNHQSSCSYGYQTKWCTTMIDDPHYFYNHSLGILIYLIDKKENNKFAFYKQIPQENQYNDEIEQYVFKTYNQADKQIDTIQTGLPMEILQIIMKECDIELPTTIPNYRLFSEEEKNNMRKFIDYLPDEIIEKTIKHLVLDSEQIDSIVDSVE